MKLKFLTGLCALGMVPFSGCSLILDSIFNNPDCLVCKVARNGGFDENGDPIEDIAWIESTSNSEEEADLQRRCEEATQTLGGWCYCERE